MNLRDLLRFVLGKTTGDRGHRLDTGPVNQNPWKLSQKALQIATHQPEAWEYLLFAQVIMDEVQSINGLVQPHKPERASGATTVGPGDLAPWAGGKLDELQNLVSDLVALGNSPNEGAFGPPGQSGNAARIVTLSRQTAEFHRRAVMWSEDIRNTSVDPQLVRLRDELSHLALAITTAIERFGPDLLRAVETTLRAPSRSAQPLRVILDVALPEGELERLTKEIVRVANEVRQQTSRLEPHLNRLTEIEDRQPIERSMAGYLYVLINPSMEGLVKIGKTTRNPRERTGELGSATGVPTPFILVFDAHVDDCDQAEEYVHARLEDRRVGGAPQKLDTFRSRNCGLGWR